jgi:glycosyltransferase involved in cell wall biosynthesis
LVPASQLLVGHIGRIDPIKRQEDLLSAAEALNNRPEPLSFVLIGQGPDSQGLVAQASRRRNVQFIPNLPSIPPFLRSLDIFVICSDHEAAPMVLLEAMSCGRAIIATHVGGIPSMMTNADGKICGLLIPPRRPDLLANSIEVLASSSDLRIELGRLARRRAEQFAFGRQWAEYLEIYSAGSGRGAAAVPS